MNMYIKAGRYPISRAQLIAECNATNGFPPVGFTDAQALEFGYAPVTPVPSPNFDIITQTCAEASPVQVGGVWTQQWSITARSGEVIAAQLDTRKAMAVLNVDADVDAIYEQIMGNRASEYALAEHDAIMYKAAGYQGTIPDSIQCWATAKAMTAVWATTNILDPATAWRGAQRAIRSNRLASKEAMRNAGTSGALTAAVQAWTGFVSFIRGQMGI